MSKERLLAFSDGVLAIIITIMVLEIKVPHGSALADLMPLFPIFLSYILSFIYVGIYWNNHHHMLHAAHKVNGKILWANNHLLFWLSLFPFTTAWMNDEFAAIPVALYGFVLCMAAIAYYILVHQLTAHHGKDSAMAKAIGNDTKGKVSIVIYLAGVGLAFFNPYISVMLYGAVALMWLVPDRRFEKIMS